MSNDISKVSNQDFANIAVDAFSDPWAYIGTEETLVSEYVAQEFTTSFQQAITAANQVRDGLLDAAAAKQQAAQI